MSKAFRFAGSFAVLAAAAVASPALATDWPSADQHAKAFKEICLDHAGDPAAQEKVATSAPWNFQVKERKDNGQVLYTSEPYMLGLQQTDTLSLCNLTVGADNDRTQAQARQVAGTIFGAPPADLSPISNGFSWSFARGENKYVLVYTQQTFNNSKDNLTVVGWTVGAIK